MKILILLLILISLQLSVCIFGKNRCIQITNTFKTQDLNIIETIDRNKNPVILKDLFIRNKIIKRIEYLDKHILCHDADFMFEIQSIVNPTRIYLNLYEKTAEFKFYVTGGWFEHTNVQIENHSDCKYTLFYREEYPVVWIGKEGILY